MSIGLLKWIAHKKAVSHIESPLYTESGSMRLLLSRNSPANESLKHCCGL